MVIENYNIYDYSKKELLTLIFQGIMLCTFFGFLFFNSLIGVLLLYPFVIIFLKNKKGDFIRKRKWQLNTEFKDALSGLIAALNTGYSIENAFNQALLDLRQMYGEGSLMIREFTVIIKKLHMNQNLEDILTDFGERSDVEDIKNFAEVFRTAKRTGGDIIRIMRSTEKTISEKIEVEKEIQTLIWGKRLEAKVMNIMPCGIICYLRVFSPGFLDPLYGNVIGVFVMSIVLAIYYGITKVTKKLTDIRV